MDGLLELNSEGRLDVLLPRNPLPSLMAWDDPALYYFVQRDLLEEPVAPVDTFWQMADATPLIG